MISKILFLLLLTGVSLQAEAAKIMCTPVISQYKNLGEIVRPELLGKLYAKAMLKIAKVVVEGNYETFEESAFDIIQNSDITSLNALKERAKNYSYWKKDQRTNNADFLLIASLLKDTQGNKLNPAELEALHLVSIAYENEETITFSRIIYNLIAKNENSVVVTEPQLDWAIKHYATPCLEKYFPNNKLVNNIQKINKVVRANLDDIKVDGKIISLDQKALIKIPSLKFKKKIYDPSTLEAYQIEQRPLSEDGGSFNSYQKSKALVHGVSNLATIKHFHKFYGLSNFAVLDKKEASLTFYDDSATILDKVMVQIPLSDDRINVGGAGIYYSTFGNGVTYYAKALSDEGVREVFRLKTKQDIKLDGPLYILPSNKDEHKFRIKNKRLAFSDYQFYRKSRNYNYSINSEIKFKLEIKHNYKSKFVKTYISTLEKEKNRLMEILKVDNDDYNMLAGFAIGVLAPESDFGNNWKYVLKEFFPGAVAIGKGNGLDISKNSRGPTQIKYISENVMNEYKMTKMSLSEPENAAVATIAISADFLKQLRIIGSGHKVINEENIQNYLYYLYQGKRAQIEKDMATPEDNIAIKKIMTVVQGLEFLEY